MVHPRNAPFSPEEDRPGRAFDRRLMARLLRYGFPYRRSMAAVVGLILATSFLDLAGPFIVKWTIDGPLRAAVAGVPSAAPAGVTPGGSWAGSATKALLGAVFLYLVVTAALLFLRNQQGISMATIGQRVMRDLRLEVFRHLQRLPLSFFDRSPVGRLTTRVTNDIEALNQLFASGVVTFLADLLVLGGITAALLWVNVPLALTTLAILPPLLALTFFFRRAAQRSYRETRSQLAHLNGFTQESLQGMTVIQLFTRERENARRFREINGRYLDAFQRTVFAYSLYFPAVELIAAGALVAILWRGGVGLRAGGLSFGEFYLFWSFLGRFMSPVRDMAERYNVLQSAMAAAERIFKVLDVPAPASRALEKEPSAAPARDPAAAPASPAAVPAASLSGAPATVAITAPASAAPPYPRLRGEVEFRDVWFSYGKNGADGPWALRGASFKAQPGETIAIVGATGAGKSTLASLLARFYEPQMGRILVDGRDLAEYPLEEFRRRIGVVLQDPFLFTRSIRENIRLGRREVSDEAVASAARRTNVDRFVSHLPGGLDAVLGERGAGLSAGEKQLLTFARALVHDPDILILDEATAHVDAATEALIRSALRELLVGRTSIVIAHRLSTVREADRIVVLHKGEVREVGGHRELLAKRGIYYRLHRLQLDPERASLGGGDVVEGPALPEPRLFLEESADEPTAP